jgi:hypothetical protein
MAGLNQGDHSMSKLTELRQQGVDLGIEGARSMTTKQLQAAIAASPEVEFVDTPETPEDEPAVAGPAIVSVGAQRKARLEAELDEFIASFPEKVADLDVATIPGRATAKRRLAAHKAIATMRESGKLGPATPKAPVDPAMSARAKQAWATRRANEAAQKAAAAK